MVASENSFLPSNLIEYVEMLLKESFCETSNYGWLKSKHIQPEIEKSTVELYHLRPMVQKMSSESCTIIAVKLEILTDGVYSAAAILATFKKLLLEQHSIQLLEYSVRNAKDKKKNSRNTVHPGLMSKGRFSTVFSIIN